MINNKKLVSFLLRAGLACVFLYAATASLLEPSSWVGFIATQLRNILPEKLLLSGFSLYEIALSLWLLSGKKIFVSAIVSGITLSLIIFQNIMSLDIVFRDLAILSGALALAALHYKDTE